MKNTISELDLKRWVDTVNAVPENPRFLLKWIEGALKDFFPFGSIYCAYAEVILGQINIVESIAVGHSDSYLKQIDSTFYIGRRGALEYWLKTRTPFFIDLKSSNSNASLFEIKEIEEFGLKNVVAHGIIGLDSTSGTYFSFSGFDGDVSLWHINRVKLICPVLHELFIGYLSSSRQPMNKFNYLTERQKTIVRLLARGLDDKSIGRELNISEKTVRNQLTAIYAKVGVHKRVQLIGLVR